MRRDLVLPTVLKSKKSAMKFIVFAATIVFIWNAHSAELDSVTPRGIELEDGINEINIIISKRFQEGVKRANSKQLNDIEGTESHEFCDEEILYDSIRSAIFQTGLSGTGSLKGYALDKQLRVLLEKFSYALPLELSIMRDWNYLDGLSLKLKGLTSIIQVNGHLIGLDKLGHFFAEGWSYFEQVYLNGEGIREAMEWGIEKERGKYGYTTTGIFSYADLVANFNGMRFWNRILLKDHDPLKNYFEGLFDRAYVECEYNIVETIVHLYRQDWNFEEFKIVKAWKINHHFDFRYYLDGAWDEGINCNSYASIPLEEKISRRIQEVVPGFKCPIEPVECLMARDKYGSYAKKILHPNCLINHI